MKYACDYCGGLYAEKDAALNCERSCLEKVCVELGHDWDHTWTIAADEDDDRVYRRCRRCSHFAGEARVNWKSEAVQELTGRLWEIAMKEAGK